MPWRQARLRRRCGAGLVWQWRRLFDLQAVFTETRNGGFTDRLGLDVTQGNSDSLEVSADALFETTIQGGTTLFADLAVHHELRDDTRAIAAGSEAFWGMNDTWVRLSLGNAIPSGRHGRPIWPGTPRAMGGGSGSGTEYGVRAGIRIEF